MVVYGRAYLRECYYRLPEDCAWVLLCRQEFGKGSQDIQGGEMKALILFLFTTAVWAASDQPNAPNVTPALYTMEWTWITATTLEDGVTPYSGSE